MRTRATEMFGLELPIFAFSHCRDVVAAVSKAGGLGVLGALAFTPEQLEGWEADPLAACERIFPGSRRLVEKYQINIARPPAVVDLGDTPETIGYRPKRHFGTFLEELARLDAEGGEAAVATMRCPY